MSLFFHWAHSNQYSPMHVKLTIATYHGWWVWKLVCYVTYVWMEDDDMFSLKWPVQRPPSDLITSMYAVAVSQWHAKCSWYLLYCCSLLFHLHLMAHISQSCQWGPVLRFVGLLPCMSQSYSRRLVLAEISVILADICSIWQMVRW